MGDAGVAMLIPEVAAPGVAEGIIAGAVSIGSGSGLLLKIHFIGQDVLGNPAFIGAPATDFNPVGLS